MSRITGLVSTTMLCLLAVGMFVMPAQGEVKNIIVMISDGCGYNTIRATDFWNGRQQAYERFPVSCYMSTYSWSGMQVDPVGYRPDSVSIDFNYLLHRPTDSASGATAMSTGVKTYDAGIGVNPDQISLFHLIQRSEELGKATGVISTVEFSHATPAGYVAHDVSRNNYSAIAIEMLDSSACEVIMGAGHPLYDDNNTRVAQGREDYRYVGGAATWNGLLNGTIGGDRDRDGIRDPWAVIQTRAEFQRYGEGYAPDRLCGVAMVRTTTQQSRSNAVGRNDPQPPYTVAFNQNVPTLAEMTSAALNVLDNDPDGFFIMIEGGAIDWAGHANQIGRIIEEENDFNASVDEVIAWIEENSNWEETILIVTADHETGYLLASDSGPGENGEPVYHDVRDRGAGNVPDFRFFSGDHTNSLVPFYAKGFGSARFTDQADQRDPVRGQYLDNIELASVLFEMLDEADMFEWRIVIGATVGETADLDNFVGGVDQARLGWDIFDRPEQPHNPEGYISLYFPHDNWLDIADRYRSDVVPADAHINAELTWTFQVETDIVDSEASLDFSFWRATDARFTVTLVDGENRVDILANPEYTYNTGNGDPHQFQLIVSPHAATTQLVTGWNLISLPLIANDAAISSLLGDDLPADGYYVYGYHQQGGGFELFPEDRLNTGQGYWLGILDNDNVDMMGEKPVSEQTIGLSRGWNLVGAPYLMDVDLDAAQILQGGNLYSMATAVDSNLVQPVLFGYTQGQGYIESNQFSPWAGYWFRALQPNLSLIVPVPQEQFRRDEPAESADPSLNLWSIRLYATNDQATDMITLLGVDSAASDGFDARFDFPEPPVPPMGGFISAAFVHNDWGREFNGRYNRDIRSPNGQLSWFLNIETSDSGSAVELSWPELEATVPAGEEYTLENLTSGELVRMDEVANYQYISHLEDNFRIQMVVNSVSETSVVPSEFYLNSAHPNPFNNVTQLKFGLPHAATVRLQVFDYCGREVETLANGALSAGHHTVSFKADGFSGGVYIVRMTSDHFSATTKLLLVK